MHACDGSLCVDLTGQQDAQMLIGGISVKIFLEEVSI